MGKVESDKQLRLLAEVKSVATNSPKDCAANYKDNFLFDGY